MKSRYQHGHAPFSALRKNPSLLLPSVLWLSLILGVPWLIAAALQSLLPSSRGLLLLESHGPFFVKKLIY